ncbi:MAG TPA: helix-turn-helix domain-containing protein [Chthoniobacteraceae bacterium]|nr:helix-turn-helix domain-containing protein [Chthoniobacteraceae bacterium]
MATTSGGWPGGPDAEDSADDPKRGRPTGYAPKIIDMMCEKITRFGLSDSAAAEQVGMSTSTISRWKQLYPEIGPKLQQARQDCRIRHLEIIEKAAAAENGRGWRASAWILERLFPADYARKISERFAALSLDDLLKDREARAALEVQLKELYAMQDAEREAREAAAAQAAAAAEAEVGASASESDSHNSRNSVEAAPQGEPAPIEESEVVLSSDSAGDSHNSRNSDAAPCFPHPAVTNLQHPAR